MIHQNEIREKLREIKSGVKDLWKKINSNSEKRNSVKSDGTEETSMYEFTPDDQVATSPRTKAPLTDGSNDAQNVVWDNEDASMQDKSYSFDEVTTGSNYDSDDENDVLSDQESRYK
jgi:hypothetical protein